MIAYELHDNIGHLVSSVAGLYPDMPAFKFVEGNEALSYKELNEAVNRFANALRSTGIEKGSHVGVMLPNSTEFPLTWLALAKLGAVMVPLNVGYQSSDLEYVLNDSDAMALVIHSDFFPVFNRVREKVPGITRVLTVGETEVEANSSLVELASGQPSEIDAVEINREDLVNIQYTSGTTGFPKGCMLTHEYWLTIGKEVAQWMETGDVFLSVSPFYYMDPQWELVACLTCGASLILSRKYSASGYMNLVRQYDVTVGWATMGAWTFKQPESELDRNHKLKYLLVGSFPPDLHKPFEERFNVRLRVAFGMTEVGPGLMVPLEEDHMSGSGSVGKPSKIREVRIVDTDGNDVPRGEIGELLIRGQGLFRGYYNKPEATAAAFVVDWFRTGDLFREGESGNYFIVGRTKDMIRRSGENIAATEVEDILTSHPGILSAAAVPVPDESRGEEVKAYIRLTEGVTEESLPPEEILEYCRNRIAEFKVPRYIEYRGTDFPLTPTGKIRKPMLIAEKSDLTYNCFDRMQEK